MKDHTPRGLIMPNGDFVKIGSKSYKDLIEALPPADFQRADESIFYYVEDADFMLSDFDLTLKVCTETDTPCKVYHIPVTVDLGSVYLKRQVLAISREQAKENALEIALTDAELEEISTSFEIDRLLID